MAQLLPAVSGTPDWSQAYALAAQDVPEMAAQAGYDTVLGELAGILPKIAEGMAQRADREPTAGNLHDAAGALELARKYLPGKLRPWDRLARVELALGLAERKAAAGGQLQQAVAAINDSAKAGKLAEGLAARRHLLRQFPAFKNDAELAAAMANLAEAAKGLVKKTDKVAPRAPAAQMVMQSSVALVQYLKADAADAAGSEAVCVVADGVAYGIQGATGKVLWHRFVGFGPSGQDASGVPNADTSEGRPVLLDWSRGELLRVEAVSGNALWRYVLPDAPVAQPSSVGDRVWVPMRSGRLALVESGAGQGVALVELGQPLRWRRRSTPHAARCINWPTSA